MDAEPSTFPVAIPGVTQRHFPTTHSTPDTQAATKRREAARIDTLVGLGGCLKAVAEVARVEYDLGQLTAASCGTFDGDKQ